MRKKEKKESCNALKETVKIIRGGGWPAVLLTIELAAILVVWNIAMYTHPLSI